MCTPALIGSSALSGRRTHAGEIRQESGRRSWRRRQPRPERRWRFVRLELFRATLLGCGAGPRHVPMSGGPCQRPHTGTVRGSRRPGVSLQRREIPAKTRR